VVVKLRSLPVFVAAGRLARLPTSALLAPYLLDLRALRSGPFAVVELRLQQ